MLGSLVEGAKATVRRAGAGDPPPRTESDSSGRDGPGNHDDARPDPNTFGSLSSSSPRRADDFDRDAGCSSAAQSVSRSFSLLKASGARAMAPVKKALGTDPEAVEARESLTKYKAILSTAVFEAAATAATRRVDHSRHLANCERFRTHRREERELLTKALAVQENDLRCWGYLSVLPSFREHRRRETDRAQLRVVMAERREEVISTKLEEVARMLHSLPIIGPWTNKPPAGTADTGGGGQYGGHGRFREETFVVAPNDLLAFDEDLASVRRRLVSCDRACAAAADAFAMKVVDAGGLEPRSAEDRTQTLLALLSRYHVLGETVIGEAGSEDGKHVAAATAAATALKDDTGQIQNEKQETNNRQKANEVELKEIVEKSEETRDDQDKHVHESRSEGDAAAGLDGGDGDGEGDECGAERSRRRRGEGKAAVGLRFSSRSRKECEEAFMELMLDERNREGRLLRRFLTMAQAKKSPPVSSLSSSSSSMKPLSLLSSSASSSSAATDPEAAVRPASYTATAVVKPTRGVGASSFAATAAAAFSSMRAKSRGGGGDSNASKPAAKKAGDASAVNTEASAKNGATNVTASNKTAKSMASNDSAGDAPALGGAQEPVHGAKEETEEEDWEGEGSVGPQVVKAFINYFSREYLMNRFDVPECLVPSLTELVTLLVFRQARRLVFGYDRRSVTKNDRAWREKARVVRSVCLVDLGAPPEYVTAVKTNASEIGGTVEEVPEATAVAAAGTVAAEEDEVKAGEREESIDRSDGASATEAAPDHDAAAALVSAYSADDVDCTAAPDRSGEAAVSTSDSATEAVPDTAQVAPSTTDEGQLLNIADITIPPVVAGVPVFSEGVPASGLHGEEEKAREQENKKEVKMFVKELATPLAQEDEDYRAGTVDPAYARASREFGRLGGCRTPAEMLVVVGSGTKLLSEDAARISESDKPLDADTLLPLLVHTLVHANLPRVHEALNFLRNFRGPSWGGEQAYYVTCIEAAVAFVLDWKPDSKKNDTLATPANPDNTGVLSPKTITGGGSHGSKTAATKPPEVDGAGGDAAFAAKRAARAREEERKQRKEGREALMRLGIFLEKHEVQEDTVDVLSCAGWI